MSEEAFTHHEQVRLEALNLAQVLVGPDHIDKILAAAEKIETWLKAANPSRK